MIARPSGSAIWLACPQGLSMQNTYTRRYPAGAAAEEGTAAHEVLEAEMNGLDTSSLTVAGNGVVITDDMRHHAKCAATYIRSLGGNASAEYRVYINLPNTPQITGQADIIVLSGDGRTAHVIDYKYGHGHVPANAPQLKIYGLAIRQMTGRETIHLHVIQPRDYSSAPTRTHHFTPAEQNEFADEVMAALRLAHLPTPYAVPGKHCMYCPGRAHCEAIRDWSMVEEHEEAHSPLDAKAVAAELHLARRQAELAAARVKGLEAEAVFLMNKGDLVPGWSLQSAPGREKWTDETPVLELAKSFGLLDAVSKRELITPNQAIKAGLPADLVRMYTQRPQGEAKLVPSGETLAAKTFGK